jgi:NTE family protein
VTTAFVLSGGGSLGAVQVGMLQALAERGIRPDVLVGTSAGAVNAAYVAGHGMNDASLAGLARLWRTLRRRDVFPVEFRQAMRAITGKSPSLLAPAGLRRLVEADLAFGRLEEAVIELHLVATDLLSGDEVLLSDGDACSAILASAAIPGIFPPVCRDGRLLVDGGVADHAAVRQAVRYGADEVYVLPAGYPCALSLPPTSAVGVAVQALALLIQHGLISDIAGYAGPAPIRVLPPLCPLSVSAADFGHADELIARARRTTGAWLDSGATDLPEPERFLSLHHHVRPEDRCAQEIDDARRGG